MLLHISDIHFKDPLCHTDEDPELYFRNELVAHAAAQIPDLGDVDAILVTGDIAFKGIAAEYNAATKWLETLAVAVGCNKRRIYVVPGNHDVDRSIYKKAGNARNAVRAISLAGDNDAREAELKAQLALKDSAKHLFAAIAEYNFFAAKYDCQTYPGRLRWKHTLRIDSRTVVILHGLNSTIISGVNQDDKQGELYVSPLQLNVSKDPGAVNLVMAHHPPGWMSDHDDIEMRLLGAPNIVMFGHRHVQRVDRHANGPIVFSAGSVNPERHEKGWEPAYNFIEITPLDGEGKRDVEIIVRQFRWQSNPNGFIPKIDIATSEPRFCHNIQIHGDNNHDSGPGADALTTGEGTLGAKEEKDEEAPTLAAPNIRDLIYRFWELSARQRRIILTNLGVTVSAEANAQEIMTYRKALVELSQQNRLKELEAAIAEKEAC